MSVISSIKEIRTTISRSVNDGILELSLIVGNNSGVQLFQDLGNEELDHLSGLLKCIQITELYAEVILRPFDEAIFKLFFWLG